MVEWFKRIPEEYKALSLLIVVIVAAMLAAWYDQTPHPSRNFTQAPPMAGTAAVAKQEVATRTGTVKVLSKTRLAKVITLPEDVVKNPDKEISATGVAPASEAGTEIVSVLDTATGETVIATRPAELPLVAFENKRRVGVGYGVGAKGTEMKAFGEWSFLRVGGFHVGAQTEVRVSSDSSADAKVFAVVDYRF